MSIPEARAYLQLAKAELLHLLTTEDPSLLAMEQAARTVCYWARILDRKQTHAAHPA